MPSSSSTSTSAAGEPPQHPAAPEAHVRLAVIGAYLSLRTFIKTTLREHAPMVRSLRVDSPLTTDIRTAMRHHGRYLSRAASPRVRTAAAVTAASVRRQTPGEPDVDLTPEVDAYTVAVVDRMDQDFDDTIECSMATLEEWAADGELDEVALELMLDQCDHTGRLVGWLFVMFGWMFGQMVRRAQVAAGIEEAEWVTRHDERVRPAHAALAGVVFRWDGPPPLKASVSSNHKDCWPGDDLGCRCVPRPIVAAQTP